MKLLSIVSLLFAIFLASGASAAQRTILVIPKDQQTVYWLMLRDGATKAGSERGADIIFRGPRSPDDHDAQAELVKDAIHHKVSAIIIAPNHTTRTSRLLQEATDLGIKVVIIDSNMDFDGRVTFVASDNLLAGEMAGLELLSMLNGKGTVVMMRHKDNNASTLKREEGFLKAMNTAPSIRVADFGFMGSGMGNTYRRTLEAFKTNQDIDGIFVSSEINTKGLIRALRELRLKKKVRAVGFDYSPDIIQALREGLIDGVVVQRPYRMGYLAVMAACDAMEGKPVPDRIMTSILFVTDPDDSLKMK